MKDYDIYHIGISGGKDSTALLLWAVYESGYPKDKIEASFCDTQNEAPETYKHIEMLSAKVHPIKTIKGELGFYELAKKKGRFPSTKARFCTQELKIKVTQAHILNFQRENKSVLLHSGVRADESEARSNAIEFEWDDYYATDIYRPLLRWTIADVWAIHDKYGIPRNPLYDLGAARVGCFPCIMSNKREIRLLSKNFPDRIDFLREKEKELGSTFFRPNTAPQRFLDPENVFTRKDGSETRLAYIDDIVDWSRTGNFRPAQYEFDLDDYQVCDSKLGACE